MFENATPYYDEEGDVRYISFGEPEPADDSDVTDQGVVIRLRGGKIVGLTVLDASSRLYQPAGCPRSTAWWEPARRGGNMTSKPPGTIDRK